MAHPFRRNAHPASTHDRRTRTSIGKPGPHPARVAQFAALTFLVGVAFLLVGYALS
jgi:hypothetical protein